VPLPADPESAELPAPTEPEPPTQAVKLDIVDEDDDEGPIDWDD
jgi:hypothetical protein